MASDMFIQIDKVPGESTDDKHKDWIEMSSFSFGVSQPLAGDRSTGGGLSGGRCNHQDFSFTKDLDKATPKLSQLCSKGTNIGKVTVSLCHASDDKSEYMTYVMEDCIISSVSTSGGSGGRPSDSVCLNYGKITWKYIEFDHKTNAKKGQVETWWSLVENKGG